MKKTLLLLVFAIFIGATISPAFAKKHHEKSYYGPDEYFSLLRQSKRSCSEVDNSFLRAQYKNTFRDYYPSDFYFFNANLCYNRSDFPCANSYIDSALMTYKAKAYAPFSMILELKLHIAVNRTGPQMAIAEIEKVMTKHSGTNYPFVFQLRAEQYAKMQKWELAMADYRKVIELVGDTAATARVAVAKILIDQDKKTEALELLNDCAERCPKYAPTYRERANLLYEMGEGHKAVGDVIDFAMYNNSVNLLDFKDIILHNLHSFAAAALAKSNDFDWPNQNQLYAKSMASLAYNWAKMYKEAVYVCEDMYKKNNYYSRDLCFAYFEVGLYKEAIEMGELFNEEYGDRNPKISTLAAIGSAYHALGKYDEAIAYYTKAYEKEPTEAVYHQMRATTYLHMRDTASAMKYFKAALELNPQDTVSLFFRGAVYRKMGQLDKANADFQEFQKHASGFANNMLIQCYWGHKERAIQMCDSMLRDNPFDRDANYAAACLYSNLNDKSKALAYLRKSFECGNRNFEHVEWDFDLDNIKQLPEFKAMIEEYKAKPIWVSSCSVGYTEDDVVTEDGVLTIL